MRIKHIHRQHHYCQQKEYTVNGLMIKKIRNGWNVVYGQNKKFFFKPKSEPKPKPKP